jgi:hypothetical protein
MYLFNDSSVLSVSCVCDHITEPYSLFKSILFVVLFLVVLVCFFMFVPDVCFE